MRQTSDRRYDKDMKGFLWRCGITGLAVLLASQIVPGIEVHGLVAGIVAVIILSFLNAIIRPVLYLLSAPFIIVTLGLFMVLINAFLLVVASWLVKGFVVTGFWPAVGGALIISFVSVVANLWVSEQGHIEIVTNRQSGRKIRHIN
ncbi:MAG: phage holin family protein [Nitrospirales bacterium]|nr:phage holin family protein [Nitrospirales bacterium]